MKRSKHASQQPDIEMPDATWRRDFRRRLLTWYEKNARDLPWRRSPDVYRVWVSEIMLQQTQVSTVEPYFNRFVAALPTVQDLAAADEQTVLKLWEGLGYYRRARQLHQAARQIVAEHKGEFPQDVRQAQALPGIGRYTAGAILSIAFDAPAPILEANTVRLYVRLLGLRQDPSNSAAQRLLWSFAELILPQRGCGTLNQALMELGGQVCMPKQPACHVCPVVRLCEAAKAGAQNEIPPAKRQPVFESVNHVAVVIRRRGRVLLRKCGADERWAGLWDFPRVELKTRRSAALQRQLREKVRALTGAEIELGQKIATIKHGVTRFRITLDCYEAQMAAGPSSVHGDGTIKWLRPADLNDYPLSSTGRRLARLLVPA